MKAATATLPTSVDLTPLAPPVGNQGDVGSCAAWASDYTALGYWLRYDNRAGSGYLEPMYTYSQVDGGVDNGSSIDGNLQIAVSQGVDIRSDYTQGDFDWADQPTPHEVSNAASWKLTSFQELPVTPGGSTTQVSIEGALAAGDPVVIGIPVYLNFEELGSANAGYYGSTSGPLLGYHAITALGYNSNGLVIENSWTTAWGNSGFATLGWGFVNADVDEAVAVGNLVSVNSTPAPTITGESPKSVAASGGSQVTLTGTYLSGAAVTVGGATATITASSATSVTFVAPPESTATGTATGTVTVSVSTPSGVAATTLSYIAAPAITGVTPPAGSIAGGTQVTLSGSNLTGATVAVAGTAARIVSQSATSVVFVTPAHSAAATSVTVTTPGGSASAPFTYMAGPAISTEAPLSGPAGGGTQVTLTGTNLTGATVSFGTVSAHVVSTSPTSVTFVIPPESAGVRPVTVTTVVGSTATSFTFLAAPVVLSEAPVDGTVLGGTKVTVSGNNLAGATVTIAGTPVTNSSASSTSVSFVTPAHPAAANTPLTVVTVTITTGGGAVSIPYIYAVIPS